MSLCLSFSSFFDSEFTTIVTATWANSVVNVMSTAVGADSQCRHNGNVMGTTFGLSGVRLSSFWMCHNLFVLDVVFNLVVVSVLVNVIIVFRGLPEGSRGGFGEVHPFQDCSHPVGDSAPREDLLLSVRMRAS